MAALPKFGDFGKLNKKQITTVGMARLYPFWTFIKFSGESLEPANFFLISPSKAIG